MPEMCPDLRKRGHPQVGVGALRNVQRGSMPFDVHNCSQFAPTCAPQAEPIRGRFDAGRMRPLEGHGAPIGAGRLGRARALRLDLRSSGPAGHKSSASCTTGFEPVTLTLPVWRAPASDLRKPKNPRTSSAVACRSTPLRKVPRRSSPCRAPVLLHHAARPVLPDAMPPCDQHRGRRAPRGTGVRLLVHRRRAHGRENPSTRRVTATGTPDRGAVAAFNVTLLLELTSCSAARR